METGWKFFDFLLGLISQGDPSLLHDFVAQPERFVLDGAKTVISMSDQIPVWLKPDSGKQLMPRKVLQAAHQAHQSRKRRADLVKTGEEQSVEADNQPRQLACAAGNPANSRCRYTLFLARQLIYDFFNPDSQPRGHQE